MADVYRALWRHKWFILVLTGALVLATGVLTARQEKIYKASTLIRIQQRIQDTGQTLGALEAGQRLALTYSRIVKTSTIAEGVQRSFHGSLRRSDIDISAEAVPDLELVTISAKSPSPRTAQRIANAVPRALKTFIADTGTLRDQVITVEPASLPDNPVSPRPKLNLALALLFGLVFNGALALLLEVLADRLPSTDELERLTARPVLATIPTLHFRRTMSRLGRSAEPASVTVEDPLPARADADTVALRKVRGG